MINRPTQKQIETGLDSKIVDILIEPNLEKIERFGNMIGILNRMGYPLNNYMEIYQELKKDYECIDDIHINGGKK